MPSDACNIKLSFPIPTILPPGRYAIQDGRIFDMNGNAYNGPAATYDPSGERFGRVLKTFKYLGELRRQKRAPHKEVFYTWVSSPKDSSGNLKVLRSVDNCSNDQLTESIRQCGDFIEKHFVLREDGEAVLDLLYKELGKRANGNEESEQG